MLFSAMKCLHKLQTICVLYALQTRYIPGTHLANSMTERIHTIASKKGMVEFFSQEEMEIAAYASNPGWAKCRGKLSAEKATAIPVEKVLKNILL